MRAKCVSFVIRCSYVSCTLGCPYEGEVAFQSTVDVCEALLEMGCYELSLADTIGVSNPRTSNVSRVTKFN